MSDDIPADALAALKQARAQLEIMLGENAHWRQLGRATLPANRAALERALTGNPVFHAWELLVRVIGEMEAPGVTRDADNGADPRQSALQVPKVPTAIPGKAPAGRQRVELRQVLERIRSDSPFDTAEAATAAGVPDADPGQGAPRPALAPVDIEIEEATVSFIVREPAGRATTVQGGDGVGPLAQTAREKDDGGGKGSDPAAVAASAVGAVNDAEEVEVTIVRR
jgi:hypothetical protein